MSEEFTNFEAMLQAITGSLDGVQADLDDIKARLDAAGVDGMSADEASKLASDVAAVRDRVAHIDAEYPPTV